MSVETLIGRNATQILEAQSYVKDKVRREKELGQLRSPVYIVASTFIDEGRKELKEISEKLNRSGIRVNPASPVSIFHQIPPSDRKQANLAYAAVTFGVIMISIEQLIKDKFFWLSEMVNLFNYSVNGTFIPKWNANGLGDFEIPRSKHRALFELAQTDPSLSMILTKGLGLIPEHLRKVINNLAGIDKLFFLDSWFCN